MGSKKDFGDFHPRDHRHCSRGSGFLEHLLVVEGCYDVREGWSDEGLCQKAYLIELQSVDYKRWGNGGHLHLEPR